ncbi:MAG: hypothetical protein MI919_12210 [Holophagales bacterium]|nr:hypothetical protein [Holophagales bacterium]
MSAPRRERAAGWPHEPSRHRLLLLAGLIGAGLAAVLPPAIGRAGAQDSTAGSPPPIVPLYAGEDETNGRGEPGRVADSWVEGGRDRDLRSVERFRYRCANEHGLRELTLFANGTVRLREGLSGAEDLQLAELTPDDLLGYLVRLTRIRRSPTLPRPWDLGGGPGGPWTESCDLHLDLPGASPIRFEFGNYDSLPLELGQLEQIADELAARVRPLDSPQQLPPGYSPEPFDLLRGVDGQVYRVIGLTDDGKGLEVESIDVPLRTFYRLDDLRSLFVAVLTEDDVQPPEIDSDELLSSEPPA